MRRVKPEREPVEIPMPKYGMSWHQDFALELCRSSMSTCPFGCTKDGAPNCHYHVIALECEYSRQTQSQADEKWRSVQELRRQSRKGQRR